MLDLPKAITPTQIVYMEEIINMIISYILCLTYTEPEKNFEKYNLKERTFFDVNKIWCYNVKTVFCEQEVGEHIFMHNITI